MCMWVFKFFFEIAEPTEDKIHVGPTQDRGENLFKLFRSVIVLYFNFVSPRGRGAFSGGFTTNLARQCRAFSRALKIEKLKHSQGRSPIGKVENLGLRPRFSTLPAGPCAMLTVN